MKTMKKVVTFMLMLCMMLTFIPSTTYASTLRMKNTNNEVYVGKTIQLKLLGTSKKAKWVSGNKEIATVNSKGLVKAKKPGYVVIRATVGNKIAKASVVVYKPKLNKYVVSLNKGDSFTLKLTGATVKKWSSSNTKVASVSSNGKVNALTKGNATITCVNSSGYSRTCKIIVKDESATLEEAYNKVLAEHMKQYNIKFLVDADPITDEVVDSGWSEVKACSETTDALPGRGLPDSNDLIKEETYCADADVVNYIYTWIAPMTKKDNETLYNGFKDYIPYDFKIFTTYTFGPTSLSFNHTTFQTGETSGVMRVVNTVPDSLYEWSSSDDSVVSLTHDVTTTTCIGKTLTDPNAVHIHANKAGTATITCKVTYPRGETKVCTSEIYVSDTILEDNLPYEKLQDTLNMDEIMAEIEPELDNYQTYDSLYNNFNIGIDNGDRYRNFTWDWNSIYNACTNDNHIFANPYYKHINQYILDNILNNSVYLVEYQGYNKNGIQLGCYSSTSGISKNFVKLYEKQH